MNTIRYLSIILYIIGGFEGISGQTSGNINALYPCDVSGDTRLFVDSYAAIYPQVCTYVNISTVETSYTNISGLYFISFCFNGHWDIEMYNPETFCIISGYLDDQNTPDYFTNSNEGLPKYWNLTCIGTELKIEMCTGSITTDQCNIVTNLACVSCDSYTDCLGGNNSVCTNEGVCQCRECVNGICYAGGCLCDDGYTGDDCANMICEPPCDNAGVCQVDGSCLCSFPYTGVSCEANITCSPACSSFSECIVDMSQRIVYCCPGEESGSICQTSQSTNTTVTITTSQFTTSYISTTSSTILDPSITLIISIAIPLLCCLVIILYLIIICTCIFAVVFMTRMKHKMDKTLKSNHYNDSFSPFPDERRPTVYTAIDEKTMLDYGVTPDFPTGKMESEYIEMDSVAVLPGNKTSHYEIEDEILQPKTSEIGIGIMPIGCSPPNQKGEAISNTQLSFEYINNSAYSPSHQLIDIDKMRASQDNETAFENLVSDP